MIEKKTTGEIFSEHNKLEEDYAVHFKSGAWDKIMKHDEKLWLSAKDIKKCKIVNGCYQVPCDEVD